jgi:hypothetical protein
MVREQFLMLVIDSDAALAAIPAMLPDEPDVRKQAYEAIGRVLSSAGALSETDKQRLARVGDLFGLSGRPKIDGGTVRSLSPNTPPKGKASN